MNIKIITYHNSHNYGAMLQAHALMSFLKNRGHDVKIIDYVSKKDTATNKIFFPCVSINVLVKNFYNLIHYKSLSNRYKRFENFKSEYMDLTKQYNEISIKDFQDDADVYVAGSDQIWNCLNGFITPFYLDFVKKGKKVSYEASIGISELPINSKERFKNLVSNFDAISVRERDANILLKREFNIASEIVCDPVLLVEGEYWNKLLNNDIINKEKYILCYCLGNIEDVNKCLKILKDKYALPVYLISKSGYTKIYHDKMICGAGPLEFLSLIKNAEIVVCSSFHGTVFSTIFEKRFISVPDKLKPARVRDYLSCLEIEHCLFSENMDFDIKINYTVVREKIKAYREQSVKFIEKNIEN